VELLQAVRSIKSHALHAHGFLILARLAPSEHFPRPLIVGGEHLSSVMMGILEDPLPADTLSRLAGALDALEAKNCDAVSYTGA